MNFEKKQRNIEVSKIFNFGNLKIHEWRFIDNVWRSQAEPDCNLEIKSHHKLTKSHILVGMCICGWQWANIAATIP